MNKRTDNERLLADVLARETDSDFSARVLAATLRGVRRQRRVRQVRRYGGALVVLLVIGLASSLLLQRGTKPELAQLPPPLNYQLIVSQSLTPGELVTTQPLAPNESATSIATVEKVQTVAGGFEEIGDDKLISLAAPQVVALVRRGPHEAELVFISSPTESPDSRQN